MARRRSQTLVRRNRIQTVVSGKKLNLACGTDIRPAGDGWTNMDVASLPGVDVQQSALDLPWPFPDDAFDLVLVSHYLEHIPHNLNNGKHTDGFLQVLEEIHRVLRPGGILEVSVPHWRSAWTWRDPTHTRAVHPDNFLYVSADSAHAYYSTARFRILSQQVTQWGPPGQGFLPLGPKGYGVFEHLMMRTPWILRPFRFLLPPLEMHFVLECVK